MSERLPDGGSWIERTRPIAFRFDDVEYQAFEGDTLASALLANDVVAGFRSPILGRPRGVYSGGVEEPNAFVEISEPWFDPIVAATTVEVVDGLVASSRPGVGRIRERTPEPRAEHRHVHVELLVVGSGHDGLVEAESAAARGERVLLVEQAPRLAGSGTSWRPKDVRYLTRATALGLYDDGYALVHERAGHLERLWHVRARRVVLATGGTERPIVFADNDRPGVMLASAADNYLYRFGVRSGERLVVFTARTPTYNVAATFRDAGADVLLVDARPDPGVGGEWEMPGTLVGWTVAGTEGDERLRAVHLEGPGRQRRTVEADALLVSGGWNPNIALWRAIGGGVRFDRDRACFVPDGQGPPWLSVVGSAAGEVWADTSYWFVPAEDYSRHFVDLQRDQTIADVAGALDAGLTSVEHVKRATYIGTAIDQGRISGVLTAEIVNHLLGADPGAQGPTSARPPALPVSFAVLAGPYRGELLDPIRTTAIHDWHVEHGAVFENVGQWKRPWYFPRDGEDLERAVARECLAVRSSVGVLDASTLGKIEVVGPDAGLFLDRMYTNRMSNLKPGHVRYGLMLGLDGMVLDDGVAMRVDEDRFFVTTTTSGAAIVLDRFEEWLQTEWPDLRVYCTSVTDQWADVAIAGPKARAVLAAAGTDVELEPGAFAFMTFRDGTVAGVPARVARVSFTGELSYEVMVSARHARHVWNAVMAAGEPFGITPYGTETMHVLRAEKGFVIVGQDTDGTVTPHDLHMDWIVNASKGDFVGRRSLSRADVTRPDRNRLVGLLTKDPHALLPEGAQLVLEDTGRVPMPMAGHVTSSYRSAALGRSIALGVLSAGHERIGATVYAPLPEGTIAAAVTEPVFYDPEGKRRDG